MEKVKEAKGKCLCGSVTITVHDFDNEMGACHCDMCKVWTGAPQMAFGCGENIKIEGEEFVERYESSPWAERAFCKKCGTHLFYRVKDKNSHRPMLGLFKDSFTPEFKYQYFIDKKSKSFSFADKTIDLTEKQIMEMFGM